MTKVLTKYDSFFTDRITGNFDDQGNSILDFNTNKYNKLYWTEIKQNNKSSFFFKVKKFTSNESTTIINAITQKKNVFFDKNGNITIREPTDNSMIFQWLNPMSKSTFTASNFDNIFTQKDTITTNQNISSLTRLDFILSNDSTWILYTNDNICSVLFNPLHRRSFKNFYNKLPSTEFEDSSGNISNLFNSYCSVQKQNNLSSTDVSNYTDRSCKCIIQEDGIDDSVGVKISEPNYRSKMRNVYFCNAPSCQTTNLEVSQDSFMYGTDGYYQRRVNKIGKCPDTNITICSLAINSAGNTNLVGTKIGQECGVKEPELTAAPTVQPPTVQPLPTVKPPTVQPPPIIVEPPPSTGVVDFSSISLFINTPVDFTNNDTQLIDSIKTNILKTNKSLSVNDIDVFINDLSNNNDSQKSYKIDITLYKQIQMIKDNIVTDIITQDLIRNFRISRSKEFETTDIPITVPNKDLELVSYNNILIFSVVFLLFLVFGGGMLIFKFSK